jgi:predicted nucleic acid-binding protein
MTGASFVIDKVFLDTNVLVYRVSDAEPVRKARAREVISALDHEQIVVSTQVLGEYYATVTRKLKPALTEEDAAESVSGLAMLEVVPVTAALVETAIQRSRSSKLSYWDALIVEAARAGGCRQLLTEDLDAGADYDGVKVVNPFA